MTDPALTTVRARRGRRLPHLRVPALLALALVGALLARSAVPGSDSLERVRKYTRRIEFDYTAWTVQAALLKFDQWLLGYPGGLSLSSARAEVEQYAQDVHDLQAVEGKLSAWYADPARSGTLATGLIQERDVLRSQVKDRQGLAEAIIEQQITEVLGRDRLAVASLPLPPVLFHSSPLPSALIVSPREIIRQDAYLSLEDSLSIEEKIQLEERVAADLNVSALVVEIGGIGTYPTMVQETDDLNWLVEVVAHEWTHNYLTWHPLGWLYEESPQLRTMNETTAAIAGKEIAAQVISRYYPERVPPPPQGGSAPLQAPNPAQPGGKVFDFRAEMHQTRVVADALLAAGKIVKAEEYMERQRLVFWEHGYPIRKLNQAYFAFHGAYADEPGGAAGDDPVGPAVRQLRARSATLAQFLQRMSGFTSFDQLQTFLNRSG